jgi:hypothetical protein
MHDGTIWFDTAGCLSGDKIGDVNAAIVTPTTEKFKRQDNYNKDLYEKCPETKEYAVGDSNKWSCTQFVPKETDQDMG